MISYKKKSKNMYLRPVRHTCSYYPSIIIFATKKAKTNICNYFDIFIAIAFALRFYNQKNKNWYTCWHTSSFCYDITIFISKKAKTDTCNWLEILAAVISTFLIKKAKTVKNVLDKKISAAGIPVDSITNLTLKFLCVKKWK